ncbi:MAG: molybdopterin molybdotransferase MoeA [Treponema sp.]|nr:molybdopterin molybdotransferase MoeA [Treponema sp.]MCL2181056.1 molybdopterin molybdotransferase MoeA [Treponema sp.]
MKLLTVDTIEQAREKIISFCSTWQLKNEEITLCDTMDRIAAEDIYSPCSVPSFRRSTVDGYAVAASDTAAASEGIPVFLKQIGSVSMGKKADFSIKHGECAYVPTGAMLPDGADAAVMIEYSETAGDIISIYDAAAVGMNVIEAGEDFKNGELLLKKGTKIRPQEIGASSAAGITSVKVFTPLSVAIISTGDELVPPDEQLTPGEVRDINTNALSALAKKYGFNVRSARVLPDDEEKIEKAVREETALNDIVLISGGSSQGDKDMTKMIIDRTAKPGIFTHGLALKPGKPTILGWDEESKTLIAGLPGHPVSAMMVFTLLLSSLQLEHNALNTDRRAEDADSRPQAANYPVPAKIASNVPGSPGKAVCLPVTLVLENGAYLARPVFGKAGMVSTLTRADGFVVIDINKEGLKKNESVMVHLF